jgi:uncharacterized membrane-anchored protein
MRRTLVIIVIACQVFVLAFMAGKREYIALTGRTVHLRTAPLDPRDLFRGDYVRLRYEISNVAYSKADPDLIEQFRKNRTGTTVYAALTDGEDGLAEVASLSLNKPQGLFLKGRFASYNDQSASGAGLPVVFDIESYFVEQGKGLVMERMRGTRNTVQIPMEMELAIAEDGTAVLKGHRWSGLGLGIEILTTRQTGTGQRKKSAQFRIHFKNNTEKPLALVNMPGYCSLILEPVSYQEHGAEVPVKPFCLTLKPSPGDVVTLEPDSTGHVDIDLSDPDWQVIYQGKAQEPGELPWQERFRIVYHPPAAAACAELREANLVWHGRMSTAAFHGRGNID